MNNSNFNFSGLLPDWAIRNLAKVGMLSNYDDRQYDPTKISSGFSSYGYDARVGYKYKIFTNVLPDGPTIVDPKNFDPRSFINHEGDYCIIPPNSFALAETVEQFDMPREVMGICLGKSTYARCGIIVNCTPIESGWKGVLTVEISNTTPLPAKIYSGEGIMQILFIKVIPEMVCEFSYDDKRGRYQDQTGLTLPKVC